MRKTALLLSLVIATAAPSLAVAKTVHHRHHAAAAAPAPEPSVEQLNEGSLRMWHDLFMAPAYMATGTEPNYSHQPSVQ
jgi:hypothetical protein